MTDRRKVRSRVLRATAAATALLLLAACGVEGDPEPEADSEPDQDEGVEEPEEEPEAADEPESVDFPTRSIEFVIPYNPGGSVDPAGREFMQRFTDMHGYDVVLENIPGAGGTVGVADALTSEPDGYRIGMGVNTGLAFQPLTNPDLPWETADDYTPLGSLGNSPATFFVAADSEWEDFGQLMDHIRENPGELTVSTPGAFTLGDITTEQLNQGLPH